jgi:hypothetical protein
MPFVILPTNSASGGYNVANSLRFNRPSSDYLTRANTVNPTDRKIQTFSTWVKRSALVETNYRLISGYNGSSSYSTDINFNSNCLRMEVGGSSQFEIITSALYRDISAWYHIVVAWDTTQATASNRVKMYVNGSQITSFSTANYPNQNDTPQITVNGSNTVIASGWGGGSETFDGYMSETYFIDGQQLTPSSFGQTDPSVPSSGIWIPKAYTGTFGIAGFYLKFANSAALGTDSSGNGNTFTATNLTSVDQSTDTPTNNFCTLNYIQNGNGTTSTLTEGNLVAGTADNKGCSANFGVNRGKWFWEVKNVGTQLNQRFGVSNRANEQDGDAGDPANTRSYVGASFYKNYNTTSSVSDAAFVGTNGAIFGFGLDLDNGTLRRYVNGSLINTDTTLPSDNSVTFFPFTFVTFNYGNWNQAQFNFGSPMYTGGGYADAAGFGNFSYAVPSGYYALCTKNLANFG